MLELPADAERFIPSDGDFDSLHDPAVYCLVLERPDDIEAAWNERFDHRPDYMDQLKAAETVAYIGATKDALHRLEEHKAAEKRKAALVEVCEIDYLRNLWLMDSAEEAFQEESQITIMLQNQKPDWYVHSR